MNVTHLELRPIAIPFRTPFRHSAATRTLSEAVLVIASSADGHVGIGEGCPREYVTGESMETVADFFARHCAEVRDLDSLARIAAWAKLHREDIDRNPAAWCAIETALLDMTARRQGVSLEGLLNLPEPEGPFRYTAILGILSPDLFAAQARRYAALGFSDFKMKISGHLALDGLNVAALRKMAGAGCRIRADANNLWNCPEDAIAYLRALGGNIWAIEEPLAAIRDYDGMSRIADGLDCRIILDESFMRIADMTPIEERPSRWIPNIRVSKMGGLIRSLEIMKACRNSGIDCIVGAQVGETSILTRAALTLVQRFRNDVLAQEGAFGTHLLTHDIVRKSLTFGHAGILSAPIPGPGLGLALVEGVARRSAASDPADSAVRLAL